MADDWLAPPRLARQKERRERAGGTAASNMTYVDRFQYRSGVIGDSRRGCWFLAEMEAYVS